MLAGTRQRVKQRATFELSWQPEDGNGEPSGADPGVVTVGVTRSDGTTVVTAPAVTGGTGVAARTYTLTATHTADLDILTATWTAGGVTVGVTTVEVVGDFYFSISELRAGEPSLGDASRDALVKLQNARSEVETLFESVCNVAFVPRFTVDTVLNVYGSALTLTWPKVRDVRWVRHWSGGTATDYTVTDLGLIQSSWSTIALPYITTATMVEVGYEHGYDSPPFDVRRQAILYARAQVNLHRSGIPDRATSMQLPDGGSVTLATPGVGRWHTGIPTVDEVLRRYDHHIPLVGV